MGDVSARVAGLQTEGEGAAGATAAAAGGDAAGVVNMEAERTIKDILEERQEELKDLEQLQDMKSTQFVEALTHDIEGSANATGGPVFADTPSAKGAAAEDGDDTADAQ